MNRPTRVVLSASLAPRLAKVAAAGAAAALVATSGAAFAAGPSYTANYLSAWRDQAGELNTQVSCPEGQRVVMSGLGYSDDEGLINALGPISDPDSAIGASSVVDAGGYRLDVVCIDPSALGQTVEVSAGSVQTQAGPQAHAPVATCPEGTVPFAGAAFTERDGAVQTQEGAMSADYPTKTGWRAATWTTLGATDTFRVQTSCMPRAQLGDIVRVTKKVQVPASDDGGFYRAIATCPKGYRAFAGGGWWSDYSAVDSDLTMSTMEKNVRSWVVRGWSAGAQTLRSRVTCTDRLG
jgi:hypothetical protein